MMSKNKIMIPKKYILLLAVLASLLSGCFQNVNLPPKVTEDMISTAAISAVPLFQQENPIPTPSLKVLSEPTSTIKVISTLTRDERIEFISELFQSNSGCKLPCWWGITPGITTWAEVEKFLDFTATEATDIALGEAVYHGNTGFDITLPDSTIINNVRFLEKEGQIVLIYVDSEGTNSPVAFQNLWKDFSPQNLLDEYGIPSRVWLSSTSSGPSGEGRVAGYALWLFYDQQGILTIYHGYGEFQPTYHFCPRFQKGDDIRHIQMYLQSKDIPEPIEETAGMIGLQVDPYPYIQTIGESAGLSLVEFYELFMDDSQEACFDTPQEIWP